MVCVICNCLSQLSNLPNGPLALKRYGTPSFCINISLKPTSAFTFYTCTLLYNYEFLANVVWFKHLKKMIMYYGGIGTSVDIYVNKRSTL